MAAIETNIHWSHNTVTYFKFILDTFSNFRLRLVLPSNRFIKELNCKYVAYHFLYVSIIIHLHCYFIVEIILVVDSLYGVTRRSLL